MLSSVGHGLFGSLALQNCQDHLEQNGEVLCGIHLLAVAVFIKRDVKLPVQSVFYSPVLALVLENYICVVLLLPLENDA